MKDGKPLVLTEEVKERELNAQEEVLLRCRCALPKLQPLSPRTQRKLERYITEVERRWNRACEGWLLEQAAEAAKLARANALPFTPLEVALTAETTWLDGQFWSILWRWQVDLQGKSILLRQWGQVWDLERGTLCRLERFLPEKRKTRRQFWRRLRQAARAADVRGMGWKHRRVWCTLGEEELVCGWAKLANPAKQEDFFTVSTPFSQERLQFC